MTEEWEHFHRCSSMKRPVICKENGLVNFSKSIRVTKLLYSQLHGQNVAVVADCELEVESCSSVRQLYRRRNSTCLLLKHILFFKEFFISVAHSSANVGMSGKQ